MKTKYPIAIWLIAAFYVLTILVGAGQIFWAYRVGASYETPTMDGFYMVYRMILSLFVVLLFTLCRRESLYWTIAIESSTNIFATLYAIYYALWFLFRSENPEEVQELVEWFGISTGWNAILCLISSVILGYLIASWKRLTQKIACTVFLTRSRFGIR